MGQAVLPTLSADFRLNTDGLTVDAARALGLIDDTTARAVKLYQRLDAAVQAASDPASAIDAASRVSAAYAQTGDVVAAAQRRIESAGERAIANYDRQTAAIGKTADELRAMKVEQLAVAAASEAGGGNTDLASRIRASAAANAAAQAEAKASAQAEAAALTASANAAKEAADEHARLAAMVRGSHDAQEADAVAAERLRESTDAVYAATKRINAALAESTRLYHAGATGPEEYARQQAVLNGQLQSETGALAGATRGHQAHASASGMSRNAQMELTHVVRASIDQLAAGASPTQILTQHISQLGQVASMTDGGVLGLVRQLGGMVMGFAPVIAVAAVAGVALYRWHEQINDSAHIDKFVAGLGLTKQELKQLDDQTVTTGDMVAGLWKTISDGLGLGGSGRKILDALFSPNDAKTIETFVAQIYGVFAGGYNAIVELWHGIAGSVSGSVGGASQAAVGFFKPVVAAAQWAWDAVSRLFTSLYDTVANWVRSLGAMISPILKAIGANDTVAAIAAAGSKAGQVFSKNYTASVKAAISGMDNVVASTAANAIDHAHDRLTKKANELKEARPDRKERAAGADSDHGLAKALAELDAQIAGQKALAAAYGVSDAAAIKAEAHLKAEEQAIRHKGETEQFYAKELLLSVRQGEVAGAKRIVDLSVQTAAQREVNDAVSAGLIPASQMAKAVQEVAEKRQLLADLSIAKERGWTEDVRTLTAELANLGKVQAAANAEANRQQVITASANADDQLAKLRLEATLIGASNAQRAIAIAQLQAEQYLAAHPGATPQEAQAYIDKQKELAKQTSDNADATAQLGEGFRLTAQLADSAADSMSKAFGGVGSAISDAIKILGEYGEKRAAIDKAALDGTISQADADKQSSDLRMSNLIGLTGAAKSMFAENSTGYQVMMAAEKALTVVQLARTAVDVAGGAARMFSFLGPFAFPAVAAMMAVMVGLGFHGGSGGAGAAPTSAADMQKAAGTGTVLGSPSDKSASIAHSLELVAKNTGDDLGLGSQMLASLKAINTSIDAMAGTVAKQITTAGSLYDTSKLNLGSSGSAGILGLFASSTTRSLYDAGITLAATTVGEIVAQGISGQTYQVVEQVKKSSGFLGIGGGTKTTYQTTAGALPSDITASVQSVIGALETGIVTAAGALGVEGAKAMVDGFTVNIGKVSFAGLDAKGIQDQLNAIFSSVGDQITTAVFPGITRFQKVGEGLFETLERVATTVVVVDAEMQKLGRTNTTLGVDVDMAIAGMFDSVSDFKSAADAYFTTYYSTTEQTAQKTADMEKAFARLNVTMPDSLAGFRQLVEAQDLTTAAGQSTYATLLQLAPAFATLQEALAGAKSAADIASERADLQKQLWQALGDTASIRAADLAALDPSNRPLQQHLYDLADASAAADAAAKVAEERKGIETQLLQLEGDTVAQREAEVAALDPANRALMQHVYALQDQQAAAAAAAQAAEAEAQRLAAVASERLGLENQLLQLQGNVAAQRERELATLDPTNRAIQQQIYALTDLQAAQQAAAQAEQEAAQKAAAIADERAGLEDQIFQLEGNTAAQRFKALQALDPTNRALQEYIYALQDQQSATEAATQAASEAAQAEQAIAQERSGLMSQLWQLTGDTASIRAAQLASLDPSNRALQEQIYAITDAQEAAKSAQSLADAWKSVGDSIMDEVRRIRGLTDAGGATDSFAVLQGRFNAAVAAAQAGDQDAAKSLPDLSKSLLDAAGVAATSRQELARIEAATADALERTYGMINAGVTASNAATSMVLGSNDNAPTTDPRAAGWWSTFTGAPASSGNADVVAELRAVREELAAMHTDNNDGNAAIAGNTQAAATVLKRAAGRSGSEAIAVTMVAAA